MMASSVPPAARTASSPRGRANASGLRRTPKNNRMMNSGVPTISMTLSSSVVLVRRARARKTGPTRRRTTGGGGTPDKTRRGGGGGEGAERPVQGVRQRIGPLPGDQGRPGGLRVRRRRLPQGGRRGGKGAQ